MKKSSAILLLSIFCSCRFNVEIKKPYDEYFDDTTKSIFKNGINAHVNNQFKLADSLLSLVIANSKNISTAMPISANPYYYRGSNDIEMGKFYQAISDMNHVSSDTTTYYQIILVRCEAFKMLKKYDTCISLCNRLLSLKYDRIGALSERGVCYYYKGEFEKACNDLNYCKQKNLKDTAFVSYLNQYMKNCK